jgi:hypothetical protein
MLSFFYHPKKLATPPAKLRIPFPTALPTDFAASQPLFAALTTTLPTVFTPSYTASPMDEPAI